MFGRHYRLDDSKAKEGDKRLSALLTQWKAAEPQVGFGAAVWSRIRAAPVPEQRRIPAVTVLREWSIVHPAWAGSAAAAAGILVGVGLALSVPAAQDDPRAHAPLLHSRTMAGSYLAMATGGAR